MLANNVFDSARPNLHPVSCHPALRDFGADSHYISLFSSHYAYVISQTFSVAV